jgi:hypothetical protein
MKIVGLIIYILFLAILGISSLFFPERIQQIAIKCFDYNRNYFLSEFIKSKHYLAYVRLFGAIILVIVALFAWMVGRVIERR